jgi:hypothetical protein
LFALKSPKNCKKTNGDALPHHPTKRRKKMNTKKQPLPADVQFPPCLSKTACVRAVTFLNGNTLIVHDEAAQLGAVGFRVADGWAWKLTWPCADREKFFDTINAAAFSLVGGAQQGGGNGLQIR